MACENLIQVPTCFVETSRSCLDHVVTNLDEDELCHGVLDETPTNHVPLYAVIMVGDGSSPENEKGPNIKWQFIDDRKKETFLIILKEELLKIDLSQHPENILQALTNIHK